jgi:hypothetical protein
MAEGPWRVVPSALDAGVSDVVLETGVGSRIKRFRADGDPVLLAERLARLAGGAA